HMSRRFRVGCDVCVSTRRLDRGLRSLIGRESGAVAGAGERPPHEHAHATLEIGGIEALVVRSEEGIDLICDAADTERLAVVLRERGAAPVAPRAAECLRIERGRPRYGVDMDDTTIPQEAGLNERAVSFTKGCHGG